MRSACTRQAWQPQATPARGEGSSAFAAFGSSGVSRTVGARGGRAGRWQMAGRGCWRGGLGGGSWWGLAGGPGGPTWAKDAPLRLRRWGAAGAEARKHEGYREHRSGTHLLCGKGQRRLPLRDSHCPSGAQDGHELDERLDCATLRECLLCIRRCRRDVGDKLADVSRERVPQRGGAGEGHGPRRQRGPRPCERTRVVRRRRVEHARRNGDTWHGHDQHGRERDQHSHRSRVKVAATRDTERTKET